MAEPQASPEAAPGSTARRPPSRRRVTLFGLHVDAWTMEETLAAIAGLIDEGGVHQHVVVNVAKVVQADRDPEIRRIINACDIVNADGQPIVWASRLLGRALPERVTGVDLMARLVEQAALLGHSIYFLGARGPVVERVVERARREHPALVIAGWRDGYWTPDAEVGVAASIAATHPDILFLAIPSPGKERFLDRWKETIGAPFVMGVGGSFDVYAGLVPRAPRWMQRAGLEWLHRLIQEPSRMSRRYFGDMPRFGWLLLRAMARRGR